MKYVRLKNGEPVVDLEKGADGYTGKFFCACAHGRNLWVKSSWDNDGKQRNRKAKGNDLNLKGAH